MTLDESNLNASNTGDISADDNAVDISIKKEKTELTGNFITSYLVSIEIGIVVDRHLVLLRIRMY